jgi:uncharacterized protein YjbI with pentapeptide repeats
VANLTRANLERTHALDVNFNKAIFTGAYLKDWHIDSATNLDEVICEYIYLLYPQQERRPCSKNFAPGEFTKVCKKASEIVDVIFREGIDFNVEAMVVAKSNFI